MASVCSSSEGARTPPSRTAGSYISRAKSTEEIVQGDVSVHLLSRQTSHARIALWAEAARGAGEKESQREGKEAGEEAVLKRYTPFDMTISLIYFMSASTFTSIANKEAVMALNTPLFLVFMQTGLILCVLCFVRHTIRLGSLSDRIRWAPVSILFIFSLATSTTSLHLTSLGTYVIIHMVAPLIGMLVEMTVFEESKFIATPHTFTAMAIIILGVIMYGVFQEGIQGQTVGIVLCILNMLIATSDHLLQRMLMTENPVDMSDTGMMLYNNSAAFFGSFVLSACFGEFEKLDTYGALGGSSWAWVIASMFCAANISYSMIRAQRRVSATTLMIVSSIDKIIVVAFGYLVLHETYEPLAALGALLSLLGGAYYSWDRVNTADKLYAMLAEDEEACETKPKSRGIGGEEEVKEEEKVGLLESPKASRAYVEQEEEEEEEEEEEI
eukprot:CAMPEP_0197517866 /NCGR_PEP_ID=MMETSP1318-20131121/2956_1 /TAXON_ID=552666 /ORGANISM="Partenskyella glossopodia, Strain RCC365" /LENGTH=441 /DNA_ID=CAMNT_0043067775 /DNA_START=303 /DNA_END=1628 /DNA_ORIENTATION=-